MSRTLFKKILIWAAILMLLGTLLYYILGSTSNNTTSVSVSLHGTEPGLVQVIEASNLADRPFHVGVYEDNVGVILDNTLYTAELPPNTDIDAVFSNANIPLDAYFVSTVALAARENQIDRLVRLIRNSNPAEHPLSLVVSGSNIITTIGGTTYIVHRVEDARNISTLLEQEDLSSDFYTVSGDFDSLGEGTSGLIEVIYDRELDEPLREVAIGSGVVKLTLSDRSEFFTTFNETDDSSIFYTLSSTSDSVQDENVVNLAFSELEPGFVQTVGFWADHINTRNAAGATTTPIEIMVNGHDVSAIIGSIEYQTNIEDGFQLLAHLSQFIGIDDTAGVYNYTVNTPGFWAGLGSVALSLLPIFIIIAVLLFFLRQAQGGGSQAMNFGRSRAKSFESTAALVTFKDVAGLTEVKEELAEIVDFLKLPEKFTALGARTPKGVLLVGPPGTGKTLISRAVAGEAGVPFFSISGSEFVEMFVGVGASRVRDMFTQAKKQSPCIIFIDEIDAVGRQRGTGLGGGHDEREQTLNQILVEMDGFDARTNVIILAATNRDDVLDPALVRPGRFDRRVVLDAPDRRGREEIIGVHAKGKPFSPEVNFETVARQTPGFSGADLANLVNEAALMTARNSKTEIGMHELTEAIDRVSMGPARKSRLMSKKEREITAYHEAGHALAAHFIPAGPNVGKISITARGRAGGFTRFQDDDDTYHTLEEFEALIASMMGGRVAEEFKFGSFTTGASSDIERATQVARNMVTRFGMSKKLGARTYGKREEAVFLGRDMSEQRDYSLESEAKIDEEINQILDAALANARKVMEDNSEVLEKVAKYLLDYETLEADEFTALLEGKLVHKPPAIESKPAAAPDGQQPEPGDDKLPGTNRPPKEALGLSS